MLRGLVAAGRSSVPRLSSACRPTTLLAPRALAPAACRLLSSKRPELTLEQALTSSHLIIGALYAPNAVQHLSGVAKSDDLLAKWQQTNAILIHATLTVLPKVGFSADGPGLQAYSEAFADRMRREPDEVRTTLQSLNDAKWRVLLKNAFNTEPADRMDLAKARELAIALVDAMQDPALIAQVEQARDGLASRLPEQERQTMVARALVQVQLDVVAAHGFAGDAGYAQAQVCLMEHANDAVVTASVAAATANLYARAGINLQEAMAAFQKGGGGTSA